MQSVPHRDQYVESGSMSDSLLKIQTCKIGGICAWPHHKQRQRLSSIPQENGIDRSKSDKFNIQGSHVGTVTPEPSLESDTWSFRFFRYAHLLCDVIQYYGFLRLRVSVSSKPTLTPENDVTVISATLGEEENYVQTVKSWLDCNPKAINIVTVRRAALRMKNLVGKLDDKRITVYTVDKADIRLQLTKGIRNTSTKLLVLVDDDSRWSSQTLESITSSFTNPAVGGVNTIQFVRQRLDSLTIWESFGSLNLVRRNILHSALAHFNDGQVLNLSGRTAGYRTAILKSEEFFQAFLNDFWRGKYLIRTGDDSFITSWIIRRRWKTVFLNQLDTAITTTVNHDATYLLQVLRWSRDTARHYMRDLGFAFKSNESRFYTHAILKCIANYATDIIVIGELGFLFAITITEYFSIQAIDRQVLKLWTDHLFISSAFTVFEHLPFFLDRKKLRFIPGAVLYMYLHAFIVLFALFTLQVNVWGSRAGVDP